MLAIVGALVLLLAGVAGASNDFSDVPDSHPFYSDISFLADRGIIGGYADGTFRPHAPVMRQQMAKIIVLATETGITGVNPLMPTFADVTAAMGRPYPFDYVEAAADAGFFRGSGRNFFPYAHITRAQLALVMVRAGGSDLMVPPASYQPFTDIAGLSAEAQLAIRTAAHNGILQGYGDNTFRPYNTATRGHVARMTARLVGIIAPPPTTTTTQPATTTTTTPGTTTTTTVPAQGTVSGASATPGTDFSAIAAHLHAVLALGYNTTNPDALAKVLFDSNTANDPFLLDTREPADFAKGHVPGSINIPLQDLPQALLDEDPRIPMNREIVTISYWGDDGDFSVLLINAARILDPAAQKAAADAKLPLPYPRCTTLFQGMVSWTFDRDLVPAGTRFQDAQASGLVVTGGELETSANAGVDQAAYPTFVPFSTTELTEKVVLRAKHYLNSVPSQLDLHVMPQDLEANLDDGNAANDPQIISVRSLAHYNGGHVPGAINIPYQQVANLANTKFVELDRPVVSYCYTGHTGGLATMALGILGYENARNLLYGMSGWNLDALGGGQLRDFDLLKAWDFPINDGGAGDIDSLADYVPPTGCQGCHTELTGIFLDREVINPPPAPVVPPSEGEG